MKRTLLSFSLILTSILTAHAQVLPVPQVPVYEVFSSSTCPPCRPANQHMTPIFKEYEGQLAVVKYQMNWPGTGDPYFTTEGNSRRSAYGVSSVPALFRNSNGMNPNSLSASMIDNDLEEFVYMDIQLRYLIDTLQQTIRLRARIEALGDFTDGGHRVMIPVLENLTTANKKSNGENEFHNVFKKMLPSANGELIVGEIDEGDVLEYDTTYTFVGDYRLPSSGQDPIDHSTEHSVEEFNDLHAVMFVQSLVDKSIYQGAVGVREYTDANMDRDWGAERVWPVNVREFNAGKGFAVYPNPANNRFEIRASNDALISSIQMVNIHGQIVHFQEALSSNILAVDASNLAEGLYFVEVETNVGRFTKRVLVKH